MKKLKSIITILLCSALIFGLAIFAWVKAPQGYSVAERRVLAKLPNPSIEAITSGSYMSEFEDYSMDQFPMRDIFRSVKAIVSKYVFQKKDNHGIYSIGNYVSKLEYPLNENKVLTGAAKINEIVRNYLSKSECKAYLSIIPDKNYYLAPLGGYPLMDFDKICSLVRDNVNIDAYIDISEMLCLEDFYYTDQHWRQECITDIAKHVGDIMLGNTSDVKFTEKTIDYPFYGAYVGQSALSFDADTIHYLTNDILEGCTVTSYNTGAPLESYMYDMSKAYGRDPYEMFLSGSDPLIVIENPNAENGKELVVFRDSFGSSLVPLLVPRYSKITVVDLRYINSMMLGKFVEFKDQDVLFMYSTLVLNNNISM